MQSSVYFPYGVSNFEILVKNDYVFVDKTQFIQKLENSRERLVSYLRPRKFGKSLWLSVLEYYYDVNQKDKFNELFGKYHIGKYPTPARNSYRILKFDFSGIDTSTAESTKQGFNFSVNSSLREFIDKYHVLNTEQKEVVLKSTDAEEMMTTFFKAYNSGYNDVKIYLLFDEYDHFTNDILYRNKKEFIESVSKQGYVRKFYEVVKTATQQGIVDKLFITGVSPVTLDALTSGFNILTHLTNKAEYESLMGFTEDEVKTLLNLVLQDKSRENEILNEMREWYNGYRFSIHSDKNIYNSNMVLYYLKDFAVYQKAPDRLLDVNIAPDYGKIKQMFEVVDIEKQRTVLDQVLQNGYIDAELVIIFNFERGFNQTDFINFLAYLGNLTIQGVTVSGMTRFKIPNRVIEVLYWQYYGEVLEKRAQMRKSQLDEVPYSVQKMAENGEYEPFFNLVENLLKELSNRDFMGKFNEKYVKLAVLAYISQVNIFDIRSEAELKGGGYPDIMLFRRSNNPYQHHEYILELKYLKKEQEHELEKTRQEAKEQVLSYYIQDKILQSKPMLHLLTVVCIKDRLHVDEICL